MIKLPFLLEIFKRINHKALKSYGFKEKETRKKKEKPDS